MTGRPSAGEAGWIAAAATAAAGLAVVSAAAGSIAVLLVAAVGVAAVGLYLARPLIAPLLPGRLPFDVPRLRPPVLSRPASMLLAAAATASAAFVAFAGASLGLKGAALVILAVGAVGAAVLYRRELRVLAFGTTSAVRPWSGLVSLPAALRRRPNVSLPLGAVAAAVLIGGGTLAAWLAASLGIKGPLLLVGGLGLLAILAFVGSREQVFLFVMTCSLVLFVHKSFGPLYPVNSGAPAVYITSLGLILLVLYGCWIAEGVDRRELSALMKLPVVWMPLLGAVTMLFSLTAGGHLGLATAELVRMGWMFLLFVYLAARVRERAHVWIVLGGLGVFALVQLVTVVLQAKTGGVLGLGFLGVPTELGERVINDGRIGRPFGTVVHPVFLGAVIASLGLVALSLAVSLRDTRLRALSALFVGVCGVSLFLSKSRAAWIAFAICAAGVLVAGYLRSHITPRTVRRLVVAGIAVLVIALPQLQRQYAESFGSDHLSVEIDSRVELNDVAFAMIADHPGVGVGLNNFQQEMGPYDRYGLLFKGNPVHNLFLLQAAETGYVGLAGLLAVGLSILAVGIRLSRARDPLLRGVGTATVAMVAFYAVEEQLGFSLRQEIPLAVWWVVAGLAVACLRIAQREHLLRPVPRRTTVLGASSVVAVLVVLSLVPLFAAPRADAGTGPTSELRIVFAATDRGVDGDTAQGLFVAEGDGSGVTRITPANGDRYDFPSWALGGSKIVYSRREGPAGNPENLWMSDPDGGNAIRLTSSPWRNHQPKVSNDGRRLIFAGFVPGTRLVAIYEMDLRTKLVRNLSAVRSLSVAADADPRFVDDDTGIVFARGRDDRGDAPTQVYRMDADGTNAARISQDSFYNLDPDRSSLGDDAWTSYRGPGTPQNEAFPAQAKHRDFHLVIRRRDRREQALTGGADCAIRAPGNPCGLTEVSAYTPRFTPSGTHLGYVAPLSSRDVCICVMRTDGSEPAVVVSQPGLAITYFDWARPEPSPPAPRIGTDVPPGRLVVGGRQTVDTGNGTTLPVLFESGEDLWDRDIVTLPAGIDPQSTTWTRDRSAFAFSSKVPGGDPTPAPVYPSPSGRQEHFTLQMLQDSFVPLADRAADAGDHQIYVSDGTRFEKITTPYLEDPLDGLRPLDRRDNLDPDFSPDGRQLVFTNVSALSRESFILRLDLATGKVTNLTNGTSGAVPVSDAKPRWSPDGSRIAFVSDFEGAVGIYTMDARDGTDVRPVAVDDHVNVDPRWSPDGTRIVYTSFRGDRDQLVAALVSPDQARSLPRRDWYIVSVDVRTGVQRVLAGGDGPVFRPVWSPDGSQIAFIGLVGSFQPDVYAMAADGSGRRILQLTGLIQETSVDWR